MRRHRYLTRYQLALLAAAVTGVVYAAIELIPEEQLYVRGGIGLAWFVAVGHLVAKIKRRNPRW